MINSEVDLHLEGPDVALALLALLLLVGCGVAVVRNLPAGWLRKASTWGFFATGIGAGVLATGVGPGKYCSRRQVTGCY